MVCSYRAKRRTYLKKFGNKRLKKQKHKTTQKIQAVSYLQNYDFTFKSTPLFGMETQFVNQFDSYFSSGGTMDA